MDQGLRIGIGDLAEAPDVNSGYHFGRGKPLAIGRACLGDMPVLTERAAKVTAGKTE
jgi:hypothetical protein